MRLNNSGGRSANMYTKIIDLPTFLKGCHARFGKTTCVNSMQTSTAKGSRPGINSSCADVRPDLWGHQPQRGGKQALTVEAAPFRPWNPHMPASTLADANQSVQLGLFEAVCRQLMAKWGRRFRTGSRRTFSVLALDSTPIPLKGWGLRDCPKIYHSHPHTRAEGPCTADDPRTAGRRSKASSLPPETSMTSKSGGRCPLPRVQVYVFEQKANCRHTGGINPLSEACFVTRSQE